MSFGFLMRRAYESGLYSLLLMPFAEAFFTLDKLQEQQ